MPAPNPARHGGAKKKDAMKADGVLERQSERPLGRYQCGTGAAAPDAHAFEDNEKRGLDPLRSWSFIRMGKGGACPFGRNRVGRTCVHVDEPGTMS
jgi:hypothetical protein